MPVNTMETRLLTPKDFARALNVSVMTIYRNARNGKLPPPIEIFGVGGRLRWRQTDLEQVLRRRRTT